MKWQVLPTLDKKKSDGNIPKGIKIPKGCKKFLCDTKWSVVPFQNVEKSGENFILKHCGRGIRRRNVVFINAEAYVKGKTPK